MAEAFCDYVPIDVDGKTVHGITNILDFPRNIELKFRAPDGFLTIPGKTLNNREALRRAWQECLEEFLDAAFCYGGDCPESVETVKRLLPLVLKPLHSDLLKPEGVDAIVDDPFL